MGGRLGGPRFLPLKAQNSLNEIWFAGVIEEAFR
jgi:hypothetical protein